MGVVSSCCQRDTSSGPNFKKSNSSVLYNSMPLGMRKEDVGIAEEESKVTEPVDLDAEVGLVITNAEGEVIRPKTPTSQDEQALELVKAFTLDARDYVTYQKDKAFNIVYKIMRTIGEGGFGKVLEVRNRTTNELRAAKFIKIKRVSDLEAVENEIAILKGLDHPGILQIYEYYRQGTTLILITDYIKGGSLCDAIIEQEERKASSFTESNISEIIRQLISALLYLHRRQILHSDIKPENVMLEQADSGKYFIKLIDFGISRIMRPGEAQVYEIAGTYGYMAPEQEKGAPQLKSDLWGVGIITYLLFTGEHPLEDEKGEPRPLKFPKPLCSAMSEEAVEFIKSLLQEDPEKRPNAKDALAHSWLRESKAVSIKDDLFLSDVTLKNLKNFKAKNDLQRAVLIYMASKYQVEELKHDLRTAFEVVDKDDNGELSKDDVRKAFLAMGKSEELASATTERMFARLDANKNGFIDYTEFLTANLDEVEVTNTERLRSCFDAIDKDKDGHLDLNEIQAFLFPGKKSWSPEQQARAEKVLLSAQDKNADGKISFEEFMELMKEYSSGGGTV